MTEINSETIRVEGEKILEKIKEIVREGNARRIIIKNEKDEVLIEIPLTFAAVGVLAAPVISAIGALAGMVANYTLVIEKKQDNASDSE